MIKNNGKSLELEIWFLLSHSRYIFLIRALQLDETMTNVNDQKASFF